MGQEHDDYADRDPSAVSWVGPVLEWAGPIAVVLIGLAAVWLAYQLDAHQ